MQLWSKISGYIKAFFYHILWGEFYCHFFLLFSLLSVLFWNYFGHLILPRLWGCTLEISYKFFRENILAVQNFVFFNVFLSSHNAFFPLCFYLSREILIILQRVNSRLTSVKTYTDYIKPLWSHPSLKS